MKGLRAYDLLLAVDAPALKTGAWVQQRLSGVPVFLIDEAVKLFGLTVDAKGGTVAFSDLPPVALPFPEWWMEWNANEDRFGRGIPRKFGVYGYGSSTGDILLKLFGFDMAGLAAAHMGDGLLLLRADGTSDGIRHDGPFADAFAAAFFSLALLSCKNVGRTRSGLPRHIRRHAAPFSRSASHEHYVLDIPGSREFGESVEGVGSGQRKRLHIVRGHFANYTEDAPLFGKHVGRFYHPPHVRGDTDKGVITKDYRITP